MKRINPLLEKVKRLRNIVDEEPMPTIKEEIPNPGSDEALYQGCICPVLDNYHGEGFVVGGERQFWIAQDCPLHNPETKKEKSQ